MSSWSVSGLDDTTNVAHYQLWQTTIPKLRWTDEEGKRALIGSLLSSFPLSHRLLPLPPSPLGRDLKDPWQSTLHYGIPWWHFDLCLRTNIIILSKVRNLQMVGTLCHYSNPLCAHQGRKRKALRWPSCGASLFLFPSLPKKAWRGWKGTNWWHSSDSLMLLRLIDM